MIRSSFSILGDPVGKPSWQKSDKWDPRENVVRYREWCDAAREAATGRQDTKIDAQTIYHIYIFAHLPMPESWSQKRKNACAGKIHRQKPDSDNITKAVKDALFDEDKFLSGDTCEKFWCHEDEAPRVDVFLCMNPDAAECVSKEETAS